MHVGVLLMFQNRHDGLTDGEMLAEELRLADQVEDLGFDSIWSVEHHFDTYSMCPNNMQLMAYLAGRTQSISLGLGAVILPWHDPLRVVEEIVVLDHLSQGRLLIGLGRGLARMEYEGFRVDMNEARERWDEAAPMVMRGLETGVVENAGLFYPQPRVEIHPQPSRSFADRVFSVAMSPDSVTAAADIGTTMMTFVQFPIEKHMVAIENWRTRFRARHGREPAPAMLCDETVCHADPEEAERLERKYVGAYFHSTAEHYEFMADHLASIDGFKSYADSTRAIKASGLEAWTQSFVDCQIYGTPDQILEKYQRRLGVAGSLDSLVVFSFGGMPFDVAEASMKLFAREVLPELKKMEARTPTGVQT